MDWISQRTYIRGMARNEWRKDYADWESKPAGKRGPAPKKPNFNEDISDTQSNPEQLPDIGDLEGITIENS